MSNIFNESVMDSASMELLCRRCGLCCHLKVRVGNDEFVIHPEEGCRFLGSDGLCQVYQNRFEKCSTCLSREKMIAKDYVLPEGCPYTKLRTDYKAAKVVTPEEFDRLCSMAEFLESIRISRAVLP